MSSTVLVGVSAAMAEVRAMVERLAPARTSVLITGETGTGKEVVARALHETSPWKEQPFLAVNCSAFPAGLIEAELFGHVRGAFTGAEHDRRGVMEAAERGTLLLDEIGEMAPQTQVRLLRALEEHRLQKVGASRTVPFHARVLAATQRDLAKDVAAGRFRSDLLYRIRVVEIHLRPLRERPEDVPALAAHFLALQAAREGRPVPSLAPEVMRLLVARAWPGNARELRALIERASILRRGDEIRLADLPDVARDGRPQGEAPDDLRAFLLGCERSHIEEVLASARGNKALAARRLGIDASTLHRKLAARGTREDGT